MKKIWRPRKERLIFPVSNKEFSPYIKFLSRWICVSIFFLVIRCHIVPPWLVYFFKMKDNKTNYRWTCWTKDIFLIDSSSFKHLIYMEPWICSMVIMNGERSIWPEANYCSCYPAQLWPMGKEVLMSQLRWTKPIPIIFGAHQASHSRPIILSREAFHVFPGKVNLPITATYKPFSGRALSSIPIPLPVKQLHHHDSMHVLLLLASCWWDDAESRMISQLTGKREELC